MRDFKNTQRPVGVNFAPTQRNGAQSPALITHASGGWIILAGIMLGKARQVYVVTTKPEKKVL